MIGEQMEHMTNANKDKQIKRKIEPSPVLEHRLQHRRLAVMRQQRGSYQQQTEAVGRAFVLLEFQHNQSTPDRTGVLL